MQITINPRKTDSYRDLGGIDITALRAAVLALPEEVWQAENAAKPNRFDALDTTAHIVFRFIHKFNDWRRHYDGRLWPEWRGLLEPVLNAAVVPYGYARGAFPRVMLARMAPGGEILPHVDANYAARWPHKIHVPLKTNDKVTFSVNGVARCLAEGEAVEVNNMGVHAVKNGGDEARIHLIFEYYDVDQPDPDWIPALEAAEA